MTITKETIKRLSSDVIDLIKQPLTDNNIFYKHDENNMLVGYSMIIGREDTPYHHGAFFFKFNFPENYPYSPPVVEYYTLNNTSTCNFRWNPNLYTNKKVCIDILNTWHGNCWTSCQTIRSILMTIYSLVLNEEPLLNEPGLHRCHVDFYKYNFCISYKTLTVAIYDILLKKKSVYFEWFDIFYDDYKKYIIENINSVIANIDDLQNKITKYYNDNNNYDNNNYDNNTKINKLLINTRVYSLKVNLDFINLKNKYQKIHKLIKDNNTTFTNDNVINDTIINETKEINENNNNHKHIETNNNNLNKTKKK